MRRMLVDAYDLTADDLTDPSEPEVFVCPFCRERTVAIHERGTGGWDVCAGCLAVVECEDCGERLVMGEKFFEAHCPEGCSV